jgi:hypothetical protein
VLTTDESSVAVAAILTQPDDEGRQHPAAYESRKLTAAERNFPVHVLEPDARAEGLEALLGAKTTFFYFSDFSRLLGFRV